MKTDFWLLEDAQKLDILFELKEKYKLSPKAVEKDWWVTHTIISIFNLRCADALTFKGGTSLSKAWDITQRFSEDVDMSFDKSFFGLEGDTRSQRDRIRKLSRKYISDEVMPELNATLKVFGACECEVTTKTRKDSDADPTVLLIPYRSLLPEEEYIKGIVKVEFSCRNLREPREARKIQPMLCEKIPSLRSPEITVPTVVPTRTCLEKIFLLHEEFQKDYPRHRRMSRHLYDIVKLDDSGYLDAALADKELYHTIMEHRKTFNTIRGIDYGYDSPSKLKIIPSIETLPLWEEDYNTMCDQFIYGPTLSWKEIFARLEDIQQRLSKA